MLSMHLLLAFPAAPHYAGPIDCIRQYPTAHDQIFNVITKRKRIIEIVCLSVPKI